MRLASIFSWPPEQAEAVYQRFEALGRGEAPKEVKEAFSKLKLIVWDKLHTNQVLTVVEGHEFDLAMWNGYWQDLGDFELLMPSFDLKDQAVVSKITPPPFMRR
jgi:hypothetical protein